MKYDIGICTTHTYVENPLQSDPNTNKPTKNSEVRSWRARPTGLMPTDARQSPVVADPMVGGWCFNHQDRW